MTEKMKKAVSIFMTGVFLCLLTASIGVNGKKAEATEHKEALDISTNPTFEHTMTAGWNGVDFSMIFPRAGVADISISVSGNEKSIGVSLWDGSGEDVSAAKSFCHFGVASNGFRKYLETAESQKERHIMLTKDDAELQKDITVNIKITFMESLAGRPISEGETVQVTQGTDLEYYEFHLEESGIVRMNTTYMYQEEGYAFRTGHSPKIYDKNKKKMSDYTNEVWLDKGTYYFGTTSGNYTICYSFSPKEMGTNTSKATAKKVAIGKKVTCNFSIGSKAKNYWFKFRVPKKKAVRIDGSGVLCDAVYLLNSKGKKQTGKIRSGKTVKLKKGNYYVKVVTKKMGTYTLKVK